MAANNPPLLHVYSRNVQHFAFLRGWTLQRLARELDVTQNTINRIRFARNRFIDPDVFVALLDVFACEPNDLLMPHPDINYDTPELEAV